MAEEPRSFSPSKIQANRARQQGLGVGQKEMDLQQDPGREENATLPDRPEPFDTDDTSIDAASRGEAPSADAQRDLLPDAPMIGTPAGVDPHNFEDRDSPQLDWGEAEPGAVHGQTNTRRPDKTEAERGQGPKTRARNKEIVTRR